MKRIFLLLLLATSTTLFAWDKKVVVQVNQASDDIEEWLGVTKGGATDYNSSDLELGSESKDGLTPQMIGVRFNNLPLSKGAKIISAYLEFELDATSKNADPFQIYIWAENADSAATFDGTKSVPYSVSSRSKLTDSIAWTLAAGDFNVVDSKKQTSNIAILLQQLVNRNNWKSGNAAAFYLKGIGTREIESYEGEPLAAAKLIINYSISGADSIAELAKMRKKQIAIQITQASDDIEEHLAASFAGTTDFNSSDLELGSESADGLTPQIVGVRFPGIAVGKDRIVTDAYIEFELDATSKTKDPFNVHIWAENTDSASTFNGTASVPYSITSRAKYADSIQWTIPTGAFNTVDSKYPTSNISLLVQKLVNRSNWKSGNAMAFYFKGKGTREVEAYEGEKAAAAKIYVTYAMTDEDIAQHIVDSIANSAAGKLKASLDSMVNAFASRITESNYTVPSWTIYKRAGVNYKNNNVLADTLILNNAKASLISKELPYTVSMAINGDPKTRLGFAWYTNLGIDKGMVEIVEGINTNFTTPKFTFNADTTNIMIVNYNNSGNDLVAKAGIPNSSKRNYTSHKALATGLKPNTTYSYRVGFTGAWSEIGTFTTANTGDFNFMYIADTQSHNDEYFATSAKTIAAAKTLLGNPKFCLMAGDLVETSGSGNAEWEWEQWFETNKAVWKNLPLAPVCGNHDVSSNKNMSYHFNTNNASFDKTMSTTPGFVYSYVYNDALFLAINTENYSVPGMLDSLKNFIRKEVAANPTVKWKIAFFHKAIYTGASHQSDSDAKTVRQALVPVFDEVGIDLALQGHDHVYEVIGATKNFALVPDANKGVKTVTGGLRENMTGKEGGIFNVKNGTLYFINNSAGKKKYEPRTQAQMEAAFSSHQVNNYFGMFTGKFGQTGEPTFSDVKVTADTIHITTYTVSDLGVPTKFDSFKVVKSSTLTKIAETSNNVMIYPNPACDNVTVKGMDNVSKIELFNPAGILVKTVTNNNQLNLTGINDGIYIIRVSGGDKLYVNKLIIKK